MSTSYDLHIGPRKTGYSIVLDAIYPNMWRVKDKHGNLSDMVNLSRAKDATLSFACPRGLGSGETVKWLRNTRGLALRAA